LIWEIWPGILAAILGLGTLLSIGKISGWSDLALLYKAETPYVGHWQGWNSARLRWISFNNCLDFGASEEGFHMRMPKLLSLGLQPLLIPWRDIHMSQQSSWLGLNEVVVFEFEQVPGLKLRMLKRQVLKLAREHAGLPVLRDLLP
jgi:hypothetical protein